MDRYSGKRGTGGLMAPQKGYNSIAPKESAASEKDQKTQFCNRKGCSGKMKYNQNTRVETSDNKVSKWSQPSIHSSSNRNKISRNSTKISAEKSFLDKETTLEFEESESSLLSESMTPPKRNPTESMRRSGKFTVTEVGSSSVSSNVGPRRTFHQKGPLNNSNGSKYGLRNMKCNSISNIVTSSRSMLEPKSFGKNVMKNKSQQQGESSSSSSSYRGRNTKVNAASPSTISNTTSVRTRRPVNVNSRPGFSPYRQNGRNTSSSISQSHENEMIPSSGSSSYSLSSSSNSGDGPLTFPLTSSEMGFTHFTNRDPYNMDGIAEVLLALERMQQNEALTHEQIHTLETSLFLNGLNLYDQHRDMRLDIDNMSYEELLALEEKMGSVSTALPEETLFKCVKRGTYDQATTTSQLQIKEELDDVDYDTKCSICQEEYDTGDEIGKLVECEHGFHETCIIQWLGMKNWCPICKAEVAPS